MTREEILALIAAKLAGQGSQVDVGGVIPQILEGIVGYIDDVQERLIDLASQQYLIFYAEEDGVITWSRDNHAELTDKTIQYSRDLGATWHNLTATITGESIEVSAGDYIFIKGNNESYATATYPSSGGISVYRAHFQFSGSTYIFGNLGALNGWRSSIADYAFAALLGAQANLHTYEHRRLFLRCDTLGRASLALMLKECTGIVYPMELPNVEEIAEEAYWELYRGCTSLIKVDDILATTLGNLACLHMYQDCISLRKAARLYATSVGEKCCGEMYKGCSALVIGYLPPATILAEACYNGTFSNCSSMTTLDVPVATSLATYCYNKMCDHCTSLISAATINVDEIPDYACLYMYRGCTSLANAQETLPTTKVGNQGCFGMFQDCSALPAVPAPMATTLAESAFGCYAQGCTSITEAHFPPATTLATTCYRQMYQGCTSLTSATMPEVSTLVDSCYNRTFRHCTSLAEVTCLATDISASNCLELWLDDVAATGTFTKDANTTWTSGVNGIPEGWSIINA